MSDEALLTLRQLSAELQLPESTIRYYRDAFLESIPSVGTGRRRRYPPDAVAVLRSIAQGYSAGQSRSEILHAIHGDRGSGGHVVQLEESRTPLKAPLEVDEVSNLDLLAAIVDGEREQREALWQMAKEIVRLTNVLEGQDKVLTEIADRAGVMVESGRRVSAGAAPVGALAAPAEAPAAAPAAVPAGAFTAAAPAPPFTTAAPAAPFPTAAPPPAAAAPAPARQAPASDAMERLQAELAAERALVDRLRESKLQLEHRAADAEAALEDRRPRRDSLVKRLLGGDSGR